MTASGPAAPAAHPLAVRTAPRLRQALARTGLVFDAGQREAIDALSRPAAHGYYLWGAVGRGKTLLADRYLAAIPTSRKRRFHFHDFFRDLHAEIAVHRQPIARSIGRLLGPARAVLFDEFHVHDVADAVYLTALLHVLRERGILLVATSNYPPAGLLPDPLFHDRFLPAIGLIETDLAVIGLGDGADHRLAAHDPRRGRGFGAGRWTVRAHPEAEPESPVVLRVNGHPVRAVTAADGEASFAFAELCERPLGVREYLRLAEDLTVVRVVGVPDLAGVRRDPLLRFGTLVEALYQCDRRLDVIAAAGPERMLDAAAPPRDAARVLSRLATLSGIPEGSFAIGR